MIDAEVDIGARITAALDALTSSNKELSTKLDTWMRRATNVPTDHLARGVVLIAAGTTTGAVDLGGPQQGRVRIVRMVRVGGLTPTTTAAGRCDLFQASSNPLTDSSSQDLTRWVGQATTLPQVAAYSARQIVLRWPDKLWAVFSSATASQMYVANAQVEEYQEGGVDAELEL